MTPRVTTLLLELDDLASMEITYKPGDHLGVFACNRIELVNGILARMEPTMDFDLPAELQMQKQSHTPNGTQTFAINYLYFPNRNTQFIHNDNNREIFSLSIPTRNR